MENTIYALDIGTRKVMGVLLSWREGQPRVLDAEVAEHRTRAMAAGQIQDVAGVAAVVRQVTQALSQRSGLRLEKAALAVAGRNLKTIAGRATALFSPGRELRAEDVERSVLEALDAGLQAIEPGSESAASRLQCVGYAVSRTIVDGEPMSQPVGQWAERLETEVIATFLPRRVLDGLFGVLAQAGLQADGVTLEPIAALQAVIPEELKRFHLALVDIGAGTSDIAIVKNGRIESFGMVPCAGDFLTEALSDLYLIDFNTSEQAKRLLSARPFVEVEDIFHRPRRIDSQEALAALAPALAELAGRIAGPLKELSGGAAPKAVVCVGGGGLVPGFESALAQALGIPWSHVGLKSPKIAAGLSPMVERLGPQSATPLGIGLVARQGRTLSFCKLKLNGAPVYVLEMGRPLTVLSALVGAGIPPIEIYGRPGPARTFTLNGQLRALKGSLGQGCRVRVNGAAASLESPVREEDEIVFEAAIAGVEGSGTVGEVLEEFVREIQINGSSMKVYPKARLNGQAAGLGDSIPDRAQLEWESWPSLGEVLAGLENWRGPDWRGGAVRINDMDAGLDAVPQAGDRVELSGGAPSGRLVETGPASVPAEIGPLPAFFNPPKPPAAAGAAESASLQVMVNGRPVVFTPGRDARVMLVDLFRHISVRPDPGKRLRLLLNGEEANFTSPLHDGAEVRVYFE